MDNKRDLLCVAHGTPVLKVMWSLDGRGVWGRLDTFMYMAGSLHYSLETIKTLFVNSVQFSSVQSLSRVRLFATP